MVIYISCIVYNPENIQLFKKNTNILGLILRF